VVFTIGEWFNGLPVPINEVVLVACVYHAGVVPLAQVAESTTGDCSHTVVKFTTAAEGMVGAADMLTAPAETLALLHVVSQAAQ
jgi:hypothetical protein